MLQRCKNSFLGVFVFAFFVFSPGPLLLNSLADWTDLRWRVLSLRHLHSFASRSGSGVKNPPAVQETRVRSLGGEGSLGKEMATHSNILAGKIPWTEGPVGL